MITEEEFVSLTDAEIKSIHHFMYRHCVLNDCARSGIRIKVMPGGGIGSGLEIKCKSCGVKEDITDYDSW
jgi:hypothetical protein